MCSRSRSMFTSRRSPALVMAWRWGGRKDFKILPFFHPLTRPLNHTIWITRNYLSLLVTVTQGAFIYIYIYIKAHKHARTSTWATGLSACGLSLLVKIKTRFDSAFSRALEKRFEQVHSASPREYTSLTPNSVRKSKPGTRARGNT